MKNFGGELRTRPNVPDLGQLAVLATAKLNGFNQSSANPEVYLTAMTREQQLRNWPKLVEALRAKSASRPVEHFGVADVAPQALSALALSSPIANNIHTLSRRFELPLVGDGFSFHSGWYYGRVEFRGDLRDDGAHRDVGASAVEIIE